jgi:hypothetical protein
MKLHGKATKVSVHYSTKHEGSAYKVTGTTPLRFTDFGIEVPTYLGLTMKPDVDVKVGFNANER